MINIQINQLNPVTLIDINIDAYNGLIKIKLK